jgi:hypothetical protein
MTRQTTLPARIAALPRASSFVPLGPAERPSRVLEVHRVPAQLSLFGRPATATPGRSRTG